MIYFFTINNFIAKISDQIFNCSKSIDMQKIFVISMVD